MRRPGDPGSWRREAGVAQMDPQQIWDDGFNFGLERLLDGLAAWLARPPATTEQ